MADEPVGGFKVIAQAPRDFQQQHIAGVVAQAVVDVFEVVQINPQHRSLGAMIAGLGKIGLQQAAVGQPGELVVAREALQPLGGALFLGNVFFVRQVVGDLALGVAHRVDEHGFNVLLARFAFVHHFALPGLALGELRPHALVGGGRRFARLQDAWVVPQHFVQSVATDAREGGVHVLNAPAQVGDDDGDRALLHCH